VVDKRLKQLEGIVLACYLMMFSFCKKLYSAIAYIALLSMVKWHSTVKALE
jgi:hypothetical protein